MDGSVLCTPDSATKWQPYSAIDYFKPFDIFRIPINGRHGLALLVYRNDAPSHRVHIAVSPFMPSDYGGRMTGVRIWVTAAST